MKKNHLLFLVLFFLSFPAFADETVFITAPLGVANSVCRQPIWQSGTSFVWKGIKDERPTTEVAVIDQKNREPKKYISARNLEVYFDKAIPAILTQCGLIQKTASESANYNISVSLKKFLAEGNKNLIKAELSAESRLVLNFDNANDNIEVNIAFLMDSTGASIGSKKRLEKLLSQLLKGTLEEIIESKQISFIK